jgi:hypothetical protein
MNTRRYRIAIYSPNWHYAVVTPPGRNRVIEFDEEKPTVSVVAGPDICLSRAKAFIDGMIKKHKADGGDSDISRSQALRSLDTGN